MTLMQITAIIQLLLAFGVSQPIVNNVQTILQGANIPTQVISAPIVVPSSTVVPTAQNPVFGSLPSESPVLLPSCTLATGTTTTQGAGSNTTYISWTTQNAIEADYYSSEGDNKGSNLIFVGPTSLSLPSGTQYSIDSEYDKLIVKGQGQTAECYATMPYSPPIDPSLNWN